MLDITKVIINYYEGKNLDIEEISNQLDIANLEVLENFIKDELYVRKKSLKLEIFNVEKLILSVENAAKEVGIGLNNSDLTIIKSDIKKKVENNSKKIIPTKTIKTYVEDVLKDDGYTKVYESYKDYIKR